jgi:ArsR family transcriptional regulator
MKRSPITTPLTDRLAALSEVLRLRLCRLLERQELSVGEMARVFQAPQSTISRHLKTLSDVGILDRRGDGTTTYYRLDRESLAPDARSLWDAVGVQLELPNGNSNGFAAQLTEDRRRMDAVLAERRTDTLAYFGRVAGEWDQVRGDLFGRHFADAALPALLPADWIVADIGCGTGANAELIAPHVREVVCVDQSTPMLDAARKRLAGRDNIRFVQGPIEALPLEDGSVNAALCLLVLHHVADPIEGLREVRRVLKTATKPQCHEATKGRRLEPRPSGSGFQDGKLLIVDMLEHDRHAYRSTMGHKHLGFSPQTMSGMCREAGFADVRITPLPSDTEAKGPGLFAAVAHGELAPGCLLQ